MAKRPGTASAKAFSGLSFQYLFFKSQADDKHNLHQAVNLPTGSQQPRMRLELSFRLLTWVVFACNMKIERRGSNKVLKTITSSQPESESVDSG